MFLPLKRHLSLHEYQSKKLLEENGVNVQRFRIVENENEALEAGKVLSWFLVVFNLN